MLFWDVVVGWEVATSFWAAARILACCSWVRFVAASCCFKFVKLLFVGVDVVELCVFMFLIISLRLSSWVPNSVKALDKGLKWVL